MSHPDRSGFRARIAAVTGLHTDLASAIVEAGIFSLPDLELAAYDGRLARVPGFGPRRIAKVRDRLDDHLGHRPRSEPLLPRPPVGTLLALDAGYREAVDRLDGPGERVHSPEQHPALSAISHELTWMTPRRFNPRNQQWLPVWHTDREGWSFTVMYSNTPRAYLAGKRRDWVIIVYERDGEDDHCTVVTEYHGPLQDRRVVRGREPECAAFHEVSGEPANRPGDRCQARARHQHNRVAPDVRAWAHALADALPGEATEPRFRKRS